VPAFKPAADNYDTEASGGWLYIVFLGFELDSSSDESMSCPLFTVRKVSGNRTE
jgi:hypothetical protein